MLLNFFGDICLEEISQERFSFGPLLSHEMHGAKNIGNLETPLTSSLVEKTHQAHVLHCVPENAIFFLKDFK